MGELIIAGIIIAAIFIAFLVGCGMIYVVNDFFNNFIVLSTVVIALVVIAILGGAAALIFLNVATVNDAHTYQLQSMRATTAASGDVKYQVVWDVDGNGYRVTTLDASKTSFVFTTDDDYHADVSSNYYAIFGVPLSGDDAASRNADGTYTADDTDENVSYVLYVPPTSAANPSFSEVMPND
jgi:hypothetical protein